MTCEGVHVMYCTTYIDAAVQVQPIYYTPMYVTVNHWGQFGWLALVFGRHGDESHPCGEKGKTEDGWHLGMSDEFIVFLSSS